MHDNLLPHGKEVRAMLLPYNKWYKHEIAVTRDKLNIPEAGFKSIGDALRWWLAHTEAHKAGDLICNQCGQRFTERIIHCGKPVERQWYQGNLDNPQRWEEYRRYTFWRFDPSQQQVPLYAEVLSIINRFSLPDWAFFSTAWYIITDQLVFPHTTGELLPYPPPYEPRKHRYPIWKQDNDGRQIIEIPVDEYISKEEWQNKWPTVKVLRDELRQRTGIKPSSMKRGAGKKGREIINRWIELYQLYERLSTIGKVTVAWQDKHPSIHYSEENVKNVIKQMKRMMKPL